VPDRRTGETVDHGDAEIGGGFGRVLHLLDTPLALALGVARQLFGGEAVGAVVKVGVADKLARKVLLLLLHHFDQQK
jgi:hypothetical protein